MFSYLELIRPANALMAALAVFIGGLLVIRWDFGVLLGFSPICLAMAAAFMVTGAGNAINDYFDVEADRINKPKRPIPSGRISKKTALYFSVILFLLGIYLAGFINYVAFAIAIINSLLLIIYTLYLQNKIFLGNIAVSYLVGSAFLFGGAAMGELVIPLILMVLAALANFSREIVKDLEDMEGDKKGFLKRVATEVKTSIAERFRITTKGVRMKYRKRHALLVGELSLILAVIVSPLPYYWGILGMSYLFVVVLADLVFLYSAYRMLRYKNKKDLTRASRLIKYGMFLGLIAFIVGVFF